MRKINLVPEWLRGISCSVSYHRCLAKDSSNSWDAHSFSIFIFIFIFVRLCVGVWG